MVSILYLNLHHVMWVEYLLQNICLSNINSKTNIFLNIPFSTMAYKTSQTCHTVIFCSEIDCYFTSERSLQLRFHRSRIVLRKN